MFGFLKRLFSRAAGTDSLPAPRFTLDDVARRLGMSVSELEAIEITYTRFEIPKRDGGRRVIEAPSCALKAVQRRILRHLLRRLRAHPNATGFERGHSIVTNALPHVGKAVVIRLDLVDFFGSISAERVQRYFRFIGYDPAASELLTRLCTQGGCLPKGAPTSPRLSNLVNQRLDARLCALADKNGVCYSRYADDITFSTRSAQLRPNDIVHSARIILADEGYRLHVRRKLRFYRRHHRQIVTGLVVNERPNLPRQTRRRLRAAAHHLRTGRPATLTAQQLAGWKSLQKMIATQAQTATPELPPA